MGSYITNLGTANPERKISQQDIAKFMVRAHGMVDGERTKLKALYRATGIQFRYSVIGDYAASSDFTFYPDSPDLEPFPSTSRRMEIFKEEAVALSVEAVKDCLKDSDINLKQITHLITVSCTGMYAPGLDIDLVNTLPLKSNVERTAINYMGCYAAFNALKIARAICNNDADSKVLIVCTELCSIHFQKLKIEDNLLANALFGDGSAAVLVEGKPNKIPGLSITNFQCEILKEGERDMAWKIDDFGFQMKLSTYVPEVIKRGITKLTLDLLSKFNLTLEDIDYFAIHPGGKKILNEIEKELKISKEQNRYAHYVLKNYGNMSSPTVLFVLKMIFDEIGENEKDSNIMSFAFGPGLTLEGMLLKVV